jgi:CheY-like chemotaxis protein
VNILVVEDNPADARLVVEALQPLDGGHHVSVARDGDEALAFLRRSAPFADAPRPDLILLDLGIPKKRGLDVLAEIKRDAALHTIPVVVLSGSEALGDIKRSYELDASSYVLKPVGLESFLSAIQTIAHYWGRTAVFPRRV